MTDSCVLSPRHFLIAFSHWLLCVRGVRAFLVKWCASNCYRFRVKTFPLYPVRAESLPFSYLACKSRAHLTLPISPYHIAPPACKSSEVCQSSTVDPTQFWILSTCISSPFFVVFSKFSRFRGVGPLNYFLRFLRVQRFSLRRRNHCVGFHC